MDDILWVHRAAPRPGTDAVALLRANPRTAADATALRLRLHARLCADAPPTDVDSAAVDRLLLVFEELVSNAVRHGRGPVHVAVTDMRASWLVEVKDADPHPPIPAVGRDAAQGGLGLVLVARLSGSHGWAIDDDDCKTVWACVEYEPVTATSTLPAPRAPLGADDPGPGGPARPPQLVSDRGGDAV